ncbi:MAG: type II toxin-antitoxin system VapC family toxin [Burkholderiales bacterium]
MVVLDTHVLIFDALEPKRLSRRSARLVETATAEGQLACSDISLWEIAMLIAKGRLLPGVETTQFLKDIIEARGLKVLPINPEIAALAQSDDFQLGDPADRIISGTALHHRARLVSADEKIRAIRALEVVW